MTRWLSLTIAVLALVAGCSADEPAPPAPDPAAATLGFTQLIPDEGSERGLLRVTNTSGEPFTVRAVQLEWSGYPDATAVPQDATLAAGQTIDLRFDLPEPACAPEDGAGPATGVVETDRGRISRELEPTASVYLQRLWRTQCDAALLAEQVGLGYSERWAVVGSGADARAAGTLELTRRAGQARIELTGVGGSVLHGLRLPGRTTLAPGRESAAIPLEITPGNRCDEHARGQATAPFDFVLMLEIGGRSMTVPLDVPLPAMNAASRALDEACAARGASLGASAGP